MSGNIGKKLQNYRTVHKTTPIPRSAPKSSVSSSSEQFERQRDEYLSKELGAEFASLDPNMKYELLMLKMNGTDISTLARTDLWDLPSLAVQKQREEKEIEETLYKNELIEEGIHTCVRCGCKRTSVRSSQIRGLDEGESTFVTCTQCRFKIRID